MGIASSSLWRIEATLAVKLALRLGLDLNLLWVFAGVIWVAVAGARFHGVAAREDDVVDFAHLCDYGCFDRIWDLLRGFLRVTWQVLE